MNKNQNFSGRPNFRRYNNYFKQLPKPNPMIQPLPHNRENFCSKNEQNHISCDNTEIKKLSKSINCESNRNNTTNYKDLKSEYNNNSLFCSEEPILEFHGIKLYSDDLLILLLMYFLYREKVNDNLLYIALFALLFF